MPGHGGGVFARGVDQFAVAQFLQRGLHGALGKTGRLRQRAQTCRHRFPFSACGLSVQVEINQKCGRLAIMSDNIPQENVEHVIIHRDNFAETRHSFF